MQGALVQMAHPIFGVNVNAFCKQAFTRMKISYRDVYRHILCIINTVEVEKKYSSNATNPFSLHDVALFPILLRSNLIQYEYDTGN